MPTNLRKLNNVSGENYKATKCREFKRKLG